MGRRAVSVKKKLRIAPSGRLHIIDALRGFALLNMIVFHTLWDAASLISAPWGIAIDHFMTSSIAYAWQQSIGIGFILIAGFCWPLGKKPIIRGLELIVWGFIITAVTLWVEPDNPVHFGVLTLLGLSMIILCIVDAIARALTARIRNRGVHTALGIIALIACTALFIFLHDAQTGNMWGTSLPQSWYANNFTTLLGFPFDGFVSSDYYPVIPWLFISIAGYVLYRLMFHVKLLSLLRVTAPVLTPLEWLGRHSLVIYLAHQVVIYAVVYTLALIL